MEATPPRFKEIRLLGIAAVVLVAVGLWIIAVPSARAKECGAGGWPAFMVPLVEWREEDTAIGWILWCSDDHWRMHVADATTGETETIEPSADRDRPYPWFTPQLSPEEIWDELTGSQLRHMVEAEHPAAAISFQADSDEGSFRMEFSSEGIPVHVVIPGGGGFRIRALRLDRAVRPMRSDEDAFRWPGCGRRQTTDPKDEICWNVYGKTRSETHCEENFTRISARSEGDPSCSL